MKLHMFCTKRNCKHAKEDQQNTKTKQNSAGSFTLDESTSVIVLSSSLLESKICYKKKNQE